MRAGESTYLEALRDGDEHTRAAVAYLLAWLTPSAGNLVEPLNAVLVADPEPAVRASAALGLSHAVKFDQESRAFAATALRAAWERGGSELERRCVALALIRFEDDAIGGPVRAPLAAWLAEGVPAVRPGDRFPWIRIDSPPFVFCTLYLGTPDDQRGEAIRAACAGLPAVRDANDAADLAVWLIRLRPTYPDLQDAALAAIHGSPLAWHYTDVADALSAR